MKKKLKKYRVSVTVISSAEVEVLAQNETLAQYVARDNFDPHAHPMSILDMGDAVYYPVTEIAPKTK